MIAHCCQIYAGFGIVQAIENGERIPLLRKYEYVLCSSCVIGVVIKGDADGVDDFAVVVTLPSTMRSCDFRCEISMIHSVFRGKDNLVFTFANTNGRCMQRLDSTRTAKNNNNHERQMSAHLVPYQSTDV